MQSINKSCCPSLAIPPTAAFASMLVTYSLESAVLPCEANINNDANVRGDQIQLLCEYTGSFLSQSWYPHLHLAAPCTPYTLTPPTLNQRRRNILDLTVCASLRFFTAAAISPAGRAVSQMSSSASDLLLCNLAATPAMPTALTMPQRRRSSLCAPRRQGIGWKGKVGR